MDQNGHAKSSEELKREIKAEINKNFKSVDESFNSYILEVIDLNKDDFHSISDVYDALGDILSQLSNGDKSEEEINAICKIFYDIVKCTDNEEASNNNDKLSNGGGPVAIQKLTTPVTLGKLVTESHRDHKDESMLGKSVLDVKKSDITLVNAKKMEKVESKLKQKQEKRDKIDTKQGVPANIYTYDSSANASASQVISKKLESTKENETNRSFDITIENFDISFGNKTLLAGADLLLAYGRRYCLIGRNGIGKTTLLKMISTTQLKIASHIRILHVEQEVQGDDTPAIESVLECDIKRNALLNEEKEINNKFNQAESKNDPNLSKRLEDIYVELETIEADKAPSRAAKILNGLGFEPAYHTRKTREFSGGWRMRLALARALFARPDLLLLDEPTNMLDLKAIIWLENYLQAWPSTLLIVSHDRSFLNAVATDILHLHGQKIVPYRGNYENFLKTKTENLKNQQREYEAQLEYRQHIQIFIDRFRYNANRASQVQSKIKQLEKLPELVPVEKEKIVKFKFPECDHLSGSILQLDEVDFYYAKDKYIFRGVNISATMDSRICVVGENGSGKTTLLKVLLGELEPVKGIRHTHRSLRIGYFTQHHIDALTMTTNSLELMQTKFPGRTQEEYRAELGKFGVIGDMALQPIISLSGGQKSRVAFALLSFQNPNFMILDEPTNHLDMETIEALGDALNEFKAGIILVSHDERLIQLICKELWLARDNKVTSIPGGYEQYRKLIEKELEY